MIAHELADVIKSRQDSGERYLQFINADSLSLGIYVLPAGGVDAQQPHAEDEVYYVVSGRAKIFVDGDEREVVPGSTVFVARNIEHRFFDITEELTLLVFFAPEHRS